MFCLIVWPPHGVPVEARRGRQILRTRYGHSGKATSAGNLYFMSPASQRESVLNEDLYGTQKSGSRQAQGGKAQTAKPEDPSHILAGNSERKELHPMSHSLI